eukprot:1184404-Prorocentrum_minimum.AAC.8
MKVGSRCGPPSIPHSWLAGSFRSSILRTRRAGMRGEIMAKMARTAMFTGPARSAPSRSAPTNTRLSQAPRARLLHPGAHDYPLFGRRYLYQGLRF